MNIVTQGENLGEVDTTEFILQQKNCSVLNFDQLADVATSASDNIALLSCITNLQWHIFGQM